MLPDIRKGDVHDDDRAVLNVILDPIFIFWLIWDTGAAIATVILRRRCRFRDESFYHGDSIVRFHTKYFRLKGSIIWNIFTIGMSPFSMQLACVWLW